MLIRALWAAVTVLFGQPLSLTSTPAAPVRTLYSWVASWYGPGFEGRPMASCLTFWGSLPVVAHKTLPLGTVLRVWHGDASARVIVLDRGPYISGRDLDLAESVAARLGLLRDGVAPVIVEVVGHEPRHRWPDALAALQI